jgi:thiol-disulfide isomerase/thioredoxin
MRTLALLILALAALPAAASSGQERAVAAGASLIGTPAPRLVLTTIDGTRIDLGALYGQQAVYLKFWATWCVPCREQMPHFERTFEAAGPDLAVIAVNAGFNDSLEDVRDYRRALGLGMPIVIDDGRLAAALHLRVTPQHVVIGRDGRILYVGHEVSPSLDAALAQARGAPGEPAPAPRPAAAAAPAARSVATLGGGSVALAAPAAGEPLVLVFLSPWCESYLASSRPARAQACRAARERVAARAARDHRAHFVGIASGLWAAREDLEAYRSAHAIGMPLALDDSGELFRRYDVAAVPVVQVLDAGGRVVARLDDAAATLDAVLDRLESR